MLPTAQHPVTLQPSAPRDYVIGAYLHYQQKYAVTMRESDKVLIALIRDTLQKNFSPHDNVSLLDIGCHNGNFLMHLKRQIPWLTYYGGDLFDEIIALNKKNPDLDGIQFEVMDIRALSGTRAYDLVVQNAVMGRFNDEEFILAVGSLSKAVKQGGWFFAFDWYHPFEQQLSIIEKSKEHPEGLELHYRSFSSVRLLLEQHGFGNVEFYPFAIPIDLEKPEDPEDIRTYTIQSTTGERLNFRGTLFQPWCHLRAQKTR